MEYLDIEIIVQEGLFTLYMWEEIGGKATMLEDSFVIYLN